MWSKKQLIDMQAEFWVLMARGWTLIAACEAVGVDQNPIVPCNTSAARLPSIDDLSFVPKGAGGEVSCFGYE